MKQVLVRILIIVSLIVILFVVLACGTSIVAEESSSNYNPERVEFQEAIILKQIDRQHQEAIKRQAELEALRAQQEADRIAELERIEAERRYAEILSWTWGGVEGEYQLYAYDFFEAYGWSDYDFQCLIWLWDRESHWNPNAHNSSSGAHGIPQSLPASKMASHGSDYWDNGYTQIRWGLDYIASRYGSPSNAWAHSQSVGWY